MFARRFEPAPRPVFVLMLEAEAEIGDTNEVHS
jgi:hypothetical protein